MSRVRCDGECLIVLDHNCIGCDRTPTEEVMWKLYTPEEREEIVKEIQAFEENQILLDVLLETKFSNLQPGDNCNVVGFTEGSTSYRSKLLAMGLVPGVTFRVVRKAPLGDPVEIQVNGFRLCLRRKEAEMLKVERWIHV